MQGRRLPTGRLSSTSPPGRPHAGSRQRSRNSGEPYPTPYRARHGPCCSLTVFSATADVVRSERLALQKREGTGDEEQGNEEGGGDRITIEVALANTFQRCCGTRIHCQLALSIFLGSTEHTVLTHPRSALPPATGPTEVSGLTRSRTDITGAVNERGEPVLYAIVPGSSTWRGPTVGMSAWSPRRTAGPHRYRHAGGPDRAPGTQPLQEARDTRRPATRRRHDRHAPHL